MEERGCMVVITMAWQVLLIIVSIAFSRTPAKKELKYSHHKRVWKKGDWADMKFFCIFISHHLMKVFFVPWKYYFFLTGTHLMWQRHTNKETTTVKQNNRLANKWRYASQLNVTKFILVPQKSQNLKKKIKVFKKLIRIGIIKEKKKHVHAHTYTHWHK